MMNKFIKKALETKLEEGAQEIIARLNEQYKAEFEALLEKLANRLIKSIATDLAIEDKGDTLVVSIKSSRELPKGKSTGLIGDPQ